jgi:Mu transposase, C-terminal domain/Integrase core domain
MSKRRIEMHDYRNIILQLRKKISSRQISLSVKISRNTVKKIKVIAQKNGWLDEGVTMPTNEIIHNTFITNTQTLVVTNSIYKYEKEILEKYNEGLTAVIIHRYLIMKYNVNFSYQVVQRYLKNFKVSSNITVPLQFEPGETAQVDFGKGPKFYDVKKKKNINSWFFVMTLSWSRHQYAELVADQKIETWLGCHKRAFAWFGGVPKKLIIDNAACAIAKASYTEPEPTRSYLHFAEEYDFVISACPAYDPQKKGRVESGVKYIKINFLPLANINCLSDGNNDLIDWILTIAGNRIHGTTKKQPLKLFEETEHQFLKPLPANDVELCRWKKAKVYRDIHVRNEGYKYSAPYTYAGQEVWLCISEGLVKIYYDHKLLAVHPRFINNLERTSTLPVHLPPSAAQFLQEDGKWCLAAAKKIGPNCLKITETILNNKHIDLLRSAQQLIHLKDKYGSTRLENACARAVSFYDFKYGTVKNILKNGVDVKAISDADCFDKIADEAYGVNARYYREIKTLN